MGSISFNPFDNWFRKPPNPIAPLNLLNFSQSFSLRTPHSSSSNFAAISVPNFSNGKPENEKPKDEPGRFRKMAEQYFWECENLPDYRHTPEVEKILNDDPIFEKRENPTEEEIKENERILKEIRDSPVMQFLARAEEIADMLNELELKENENPYHKEDRELWKAVPHVIGFDGRPMPRKSQKTKKEADDKFWDWARQFFFGLWGFKQRPYPPGRPIDVAQSIGYKRLEKRYHDFILRGGSGWWYKDRLGRTRGPCQMINLKTAWGAGIIDKDTFIWGEDMDEWAPIHMVYGMEPAIATFEVRFGAAATAFFSKLQKGIPPWVTLKGHEKKTYKELQQEAIESKKRDLAVLEANNGVWPGVRIPSHALFLWASGSELTTLLEQDHMPNKFIPKDLRKQLTKVIPGLRPWEVLSVEQAMDQITYNGDWYRVPLGSYSTGPPYIRHWNRDVMEFHEVYSFISRRFLRKMEEAIPGFDRIMKKVVNDYADRLARLNEKRKERRKRKI